MFLCSGKTELFSFATPIGVGLVESAITLGKLCFKLKPEVLIFVGSAGSYSPHFSIGDIVETSNAAQIELGFWEQKSYTPLEDQVISLSSRSPIVNSSNYITTSEKYNNLFSQHNILLENMEFYSVVRAAKEYAIPVLGIFGITNNVGPNAHKEYWENKDSILLKLEEHIRKKFHVEQ